MRQKNPKALFDSSKLKKGHRVEVDSTLGMAGGYDFRGTVVEPTTLSPVLEGVPANRQITVRPDGKRKSVVVDKAYVTRRV